MVVLSNTDNNSIVGMCSIGLEASKCSTVLIDTRCNGNKCIIEF